MFCIVVPLTSERLCVGKTSVMPAPGTVVDLHGEGATVVGGGDVHARRVLNQDGRPVIRP